MPRYLYQCTECKNMHTIMHGINDVIADCTLCVASGTMIKQLTNATYISSNKENDNKVGELTKEYIESNKDLLEQEKQKARNTTYEPT
jgi:hypothetical protein